ncbi:MAG TPA: glutamate-5-semialdehyde dehydrogenase [Rectinema sp.]|nr:glutamate-5-semialdehyde dehydrogenase [Rectinema sp.]
MNMQQRLERASLAASRMLSLETEVKNSALACIAQGLRENRDRIFYANQLDLTAARQKGLAIPLLRRLEFDKKKLDDVLLGIRDILALPDPAGKVLEARLLDDGLILKRVSCPIGLIAMIFESRPDALVQMASLAVKSGNAIVLKGGSEANESNKVLATIIARAGEEKGLPSDWLTLLETREEVGELLAFDKYVDLVIPRGSKEFVSKIKAESRIPVLGHSDGICHVYVHEDADPVMAIKIVLDSKIQYPAACNAAEVLLVHAAFAHRSLMALLQALSKAGVMLDVCEKAAQILDKDPGQTRNLHYSVKTDKDWAVEYLDMRMAVKIVYSLDEAIAHINHYGSSHTDAIVCASSEAANRFLKEVDSASVYHNASTRFADGYRYGLGAEVGISTSKIHARGPMGLEGLCTYKWLLEGYGHIVSDYASGERHFVHKELPPN